MQERTLGQSQYVRTSESSRVGRALKSNSGSFWKKKKIDIERLWRVLCCIHASSGKEFIKPSAILANSSEVKKARKEVMGRLGLGFLGGLGGDEMVWEKELAPEVEPASAKRSRCCDALWLGDIRSPQTYPPCPQLQSSVHSHRHRDLSECHFLSFCGTQVLGIG